MPAHPLHTARPRAARRALPLALAALALAASSSACLLEPYEGAEVIVELGSGALSAGDIANRRGQHYELFAVEDDGLISIGKFTVSAELDALSYPDAQKIGVASSLGSGLPQSGIVLNTQANLSDARAVILSIEQDGETTPTPARVVARAELAETNRSVLSGDLIGAVPVIGGGERELVDSRVAVVLAQDETLF